MDCKPEILKQQYRRRFEGAEEYRERVWQILCEDFFSQYITTDACVLDLGSGWGEFINHVSAGCKYAMDLNPDCKKRLAGNVTFFQQDCSKPWTNLVAQSFDVVFSSNFLEHLSDKTCLELTVSEVYRCLKDGGLFICMGPNIKIVPGAYWDFWDHHIPLTDQSCSELLALTGFSIERSVPKFLPYSMSNKRKPPLFLVRLYLNIPMLWKLFGEQFLVIGRK